MRSVGLLGAIYFVVLVVVGNFIVLNLFLAILLGNFEGLEVMTIQEKARARDRRVKSQALKALSHSCVRRTPHPLPSLPAHLGGTTLVCLTQAGMWVSM